LPCSARASLPSLTYPSNRTSSCSLPSPPSLFPLVVHLRPARSAAVLRRRSTILPIPPRPRSPPILSASPTARAALREYLSLIVWLLEDGRRIRCVQNFSRRRLRSLPRWLTSIPFPSLPSTSRRPLTFSISLAPQSFIASPPSLASDLVSSPDQTGLLGLAWQDLAESGAMPFVQGLFEGGELVDPVMAFALAPL
jgi:hypothetical protein